MGVGESSTRAGEVDGGSSDRDDRGRVVQIVESVVGGPNDTFDYDYDALGRLTEVKNNGATANPSRRLRSVPDVTTVITWP